VKDNNIIDKLVDEEIEKKKMPFRYVTMEELLKEEINTITTEEDAEDTKEPEFSVMREDTPIDLTLVGIGDIKTIEAVIRRHENKRHRMEIS